MRVFDLRTGSSVTSLYAHHMGVTSVQADDWKIVSGGGEGLVCVWEMRMGAKLWEMHNRWDSRVLSIGCSYIYLFVPQKAGRILTCAIQYLKYKNVSLAISVACKYALLKYSAIRNIYLSG